MPSPGARELPRNWPKIRRQQLIREPLCRRCRRMGFVRAAYEVDHITPRKDGGSDDRSNLQSLCDPCHKLKSANEMRKGPEKGSCIHGTPLANKCAACDDPPERHGVKGHRACFA